MGAVNATFGIQGVREHCWFLKSMEDAQALRRHISRTMEAAALPDVAPAERRRMLSFVVVGGGPTGVELAAELHDLVAEDMTRLMPNIKVGGWGLTSGAGRALAEPPLPPHATTTTGPGCCNRAGAFPASPAPLQDDVSLLLVDGTDSLLNSYHTCASRAGTAPDRPARAAAGHGLVEVGLSMASAIYIDACHAHPQPLPHRSLQRDPDLRWRGLHAQRHQPAPGLQVGRGRKADVVPALQGRCLPTRSLPRPIAPPCFCPRVTAVNEGEVEVQCKDGSTDRVHFGTCIWATGIAMHPLVALLKDKLPEGLQASRRGLLVDSHLRVLGSQGTIFCLGDAAVTGATPATALPPTAQVARQQGEYLAGLLSKHQLAAVEEGTVPAGSDLVPLPQEAKPFGYRHLGSLAYLGGQKGAMDLPFKTPFLKTLRGYIGGTAWRSLETLMQVSLRTRTLVTLDWVRAALFGRNLSDI